MTITKGRYMSQKILLIAAAHPYLMKITTIWHVLVRLACLAPIMPHIGQHPNTHFSDVFLINLGFSHSGIHLGVSISRHAEQVAAGMLMFGRVCTTWRIDMLLVIGDVNAAMVIAVKAKQLCLPIVIVEEGLRSCDWTMCKAVKRVLFETVADQLPRPPVDADKNLQAEGVDVLRILYVGSLMHSRFLITASGRGQGKTTCLRIPCLTFRPYAKSPIAIEVETYDQAPRESLPRQEVNTLTGDWKTSRSSNLWDGHTYWRIAAAHRGWLAGGEWGAP